MSKNENTDSRVALDIIKAAKVPEGIYKDMTQTQLNGLAKSLDPKWKVPKEPRDLRTVLETHTPTKGGSAGKEGMYLKIQKGTFGGFYERLCDGGSLNDEGKKRAVELLTGIANGAADLLNEISA